MKKCIGCGNKKDEEEMIDGLFCNKTWMFMYYHGRAPRHHVHPQEED